MADANSTQVPIHLDDVVSYLASCSEAFGHLDAILAAVEQHPECSPHIKSLAGAGRYIAQDFDNYADCRREEVKANGVREHPRPANRN